MTLEELQQQRETTVREHEEAKATMYRTDGALSLLDHLIQKLQTPPIVTPETEHT